MEQAHKRRSAGVPAGGFTLVELVVALTVTAVALSVLIAMFNASLGLSNEARGRIMAGELAEAHLNALLASPEMFLWHRDAPNAAGLFAITLGTDDPRAGNVVSTPEVQLATRHAQERSESLYRRYRWQAWGRLPAPDAPAYEITVAVRWQARGRTRTLTLTSSIPRHRVEHAPTPVLADGGNDS